MATLIFMFSLTAGLFRRKTEANTRTSGEGLLPPPIAVFSAGGYGVASTAETDVAVTVGKPPETISLMFGSA